MSKDTKIPELSNREIDSHIIGSLREGRMPGMQEAEYFQNEKCLCTIEHFLERVEHLYKIHYEEYGLNNKPVIEKVIFYLNEAGLRHNKVKTRVEDKKCNHITIDNLYITLIRKGLKLSKEDLRALIGSDAIKTFHPFGEYLDNLRNLKFDKEQDYFKILAQYIATDTPGFFATMLKKHLIRTIDQYKRGVPNRFVFVLYGGQDKGKSIFIKWLNPLNDYYYSEQPLRGDKDCEILLATVLIYSIEELEGLSKQEITKTKSFISRAIINERRPYGSEAIPMPRLATIFASTNDREFLTDVVNTRWIIFDVKKIGYDYNNLKTGRKDFDINSLWAQAYHEWQTDNSAGMLTPEEKELQAKINKEYEISSPEYHLIIKHLRKPDENDQQKEETQFPGGEGIEFLSSTDILIRLTGLYPSIKINSTWIGREMKRAGFESSWKWINSRAIRGYEVVWVEQGNILDKPKLPF
ncbi:MAG: VapE family protein [Bacteroidales bacterium]